MSSHLANRIPDTTCVFEPLAFRGVSATFLLPARANNYLLVFDMFRSVSVRSGHHSVTDSVLGSKKKLSGHAKPDTDSHVFSKARSLLQLFFCGNRSHCIWYSFLVWGTFAFVGLKPFLARNLIVICSRG